MESSAARTQALVAGSFAAGQWLCVLSLLACTGLACSKSESPIDDAAAAHGGANSSTAGTPGTAG
ncbi:MAG TPA: hypothetical protein VGC79_10455, partial [Polyangiaceae bacterium]